MVLIWEDRVILTRLEIKTAVPTAEAGSNFDMFVLGSSIGTQHFKRDLHLGRLSLDVGGNKISDAPLHEFPFKLDALPFPLKYCFFPPPTPLRKVLRPVR